MLNPATLALAKVFLKTFLRDRQSIFFSLFFPLLLMIALGLANSRSDDRIPLGIADLANNQLSQSFIESLRDGSTFEISFDSEAVLRNQLIEGELSLVMVLPEEFSSEADSSDVRIVVDAAQVRQLAFIIPVVEQALLSIEREFRKTSAMFNLVIEDVKARSQRYLDFLLPGILAFTLMQISIAGSGFNIVEYRRKGILKRLFVTPVTPGQFISAIVIARLFLCLTQLSVLLAIAVWFLGVPIVGNVVSLYVIVILGGILFLCIGFSLGSIAKTQQSVQAIGNLVIFPQIFLSGVFFPIGAMPEVIQPIASVLPLSFVASALREIASNGTSLFALGFDLIGIAVWIVLGYWLATRYFVWKDVAV